MGLLLGSCWDHFGSMLESFWDMFLGMLCHLGGRGDDYFLSFIVIFIRDRLDYVFFNKKEVTDFLKETNLADIPFLRLFENIRDKKVSVTKKIDDILSICP